MRPDMTQFEEERAIPLRIWRWLWDIDNQVQGRSGRSRQMDEDIMLWTKLLGVSIPCRVGLFFSTGSLRSSVMHNDPQPAEGRQTNSYDCGLWVMQVMKGISQGSTSCQIRSQDLNLSRSDVREIFNKAG